MADLTWEEEKKLVDEMVEKDLSISIKKMLKKKSFDTEEKHGWKAELLHVGLEYKDFLHITLHITPKSMPIIGVTIDLDFHTLYSRGCCSELDKWGGYDASKYDLPTLVKLRALRVVFDVCKMVGGQMVASIAGCTYVKVAFGDKSGILWYYKGY